MVVKTRLLHNKSSLRRSFRTRPSNQFPVILVDHQEVKLFGDDSFDDDFVLKSPSARKPRKKNEEPTKVFANVTNVPPISEPEEDEPMLEKLNEELESAHDFSLYIENEEGVRMKAVGNKLVRYDEYYGKKSDGRSVPTKTAEQVPSLSSSERDLQLCKFRKAVYALYGLPPPPKPRNSCGTLYTPHGIANYSSARERLSLLRPISRASLAAEPIEELTEPDTMETLSLRVVDKENGACTNVTTTKIATTPKGRTSMVKGGQMKSLAVPARTSDNVITPVHPQSLQNLSASPLPDVHHMQGPECSSTPIQRGFPQAQSTPLTDRFGDSNSRKSSSKDGFDANSDGTLPVVASMHSSTCEPEEKESDLSRGDDPMVDSDESSLAAAFNLSLRVSAGHNDSCGTLATLAEDVPFQCTNAGRNATSMTINTTYRGNISCLKNTSFIDIPYYLRGFADFETSTPLSQLLFVINQPEVIEWRDLPEDVFSEPRKLGEGVYGEVFATKFNGKPTALKVVPFHGDVPVYKEKVNGEYLLDANSILPEILINRELSALFNPSADFSTPNFIELLNTRVVRGMYPEEFMAAWNEYDEAKGSENDPPDSYASEQQLFIAMGMVMGGVDLEHYQMKNEDQVMSVLLQIAVSLVVAEERLEFEHRDLHIGNALVLESDEDLEYRYGGGDMILRSYGLKVNLIDFTLSRMSKEGTTIFRNLENDEELFAGDGDYQFDIYRMMRKSNEGDWLAFNPKSNCFWMHYLAVQLINIRKCKKPIPKKRRNELMRIWDHLLEFDSLRELFIHDDFYDVLQRHLIIKQQSVPVE